MRDLKNKLTSSKNTKNIKNRRGKSFGYQVLGFGAGGGVAPNPFTSDYLMVAGGGGGTGQITGGGGGGGLLYSYCNACAAGIGFDTGIYDITIGGAGPGGTGAAPTSANGGDTIIASGSGALASICKTATGGGSVGCSPGPNPYGTPGGSGSGGKWETNPATGAGGAGNTPAVATSLGGPQGNNGGAATGGGAGGGGGGGRGAVGATAPGTLAGAVGGRGGAGIANSITGSSLSYAGGAGGGAYNPGTAGGASPCGTGGAGVPGTGGSAAGPGNDGTTNRGGGGGSNGETSGTNSNRSGNGGSGVVVLRYPNAIAPSITLSPGTNTTSPVPGCQTAATFTVSGTFCVAGG